MEARFNGIHFLTNLTSSCVSIVRNILYSQEEEAKLLVKEAIAAGIFNDLGSGSNVDLCVIKKDSVQYCRPYECLNEKGTK